MTEKRIKIILETDQAKGAAKEFNASMVNIGANADKVNVSFKTTNQEINKTYDRSRQISNNVSKINNDYRQIANSTTVINNNISKTNDSISGVGTSLTRVAAAVAAALSVRELGQYADAWATVGNRIRQATNTIGEYEAVQARVFQIAQSGRVDVEGVAAAFQRIDNAVKEYGASQSDVIDVVDGLTKAFAANGATAAEVSSTLIQLSQGFGAGRLNGDELRAVMEASLPVARAIAKEFGVNVGQLKELGEAGELVTDRVFKAIKSELPAFQAAFDQAIPTIAGSITVADNSIKQFIGTFNETTGIGETVAVAIRDIAGALDELSKLIKAGVFGEFGDLFAGQIDRALFALKDFSEQFGITQEQLLLSSEAWSGQVSKLLRDAFLNAIPNITALVQVAAVEFAAFIDTIVVKLESALDLESYVKGKFGGDLTAEAEELKKTLQTIEYNRQSTINSILSANDAEKKNTSDTINRSKLKIKEYELELQLNNELLSVERKRTALPTVDKKAAVEVTKVQKRITGSEAKADELFAGREEKSDTLNQSLTLENELIRKSLETRASLYATYGATVNDINAGYFEQQRARLELGIAEQAAREQEQLQKELAGLSERRTAVQNETELTEFGKAEALRAIDEQIILQRETTEQRLTEIQAEATYARQQLAFDEGQRMIAVQQEIQNNYLNTAKVGIDALVNLIGGSKKAGKALRLVQAGISAFQVYAGHQAAAAQILATPPGPILNPTLGPLAASVSLAGKVSAAAIMAGAAADAFSGGGGSNIGFGGGSQSSVAPNLPQQQEQVQSLSIIGSESLKRELEEFAAADGVIPARTMLRYLNSVEGARRIGS